MSTPPPDPPPPSGHRKPLPQPEPDEPPKPPAIPWHALAEHRIRQAQLEGKFDHVEGTGKPFSWDNAPDDEDWWIRQKLHDEGLAISHPLLAVRRRIEQVRRELPRLGFESDVRVRIEALNKEIREAIASPHPGPPIVVLPLDVEEEVAAWRAALRTRSGLPPGSSAQNSPP